MTIKQLPKLNHLPPKVAINLELQEGIPIFRASEAIQNRIEELLYIQQESGLTLDLENELDSYEEIDDYLSFVNRTLRNLYFKNKNVN